MALSTQILPSFTTVNTIAPDTIMSKLSLNCAHLIDESDSLADFITKIGRQYKKQHKIFNPYDFYAAYNLKFPTTPSTVSLINETKRIAAAIPDLAALLTHLIKNHKQNAPYAIFLSLAGHSPAEILRLKRDIFQQFIYLRMYLPIIIADDIQKAKIIFSQLINTKEYGYTDITFIGTKKAGKSSLINAILGQNYSPASSELPTPNKVTYAWSGNKDRSLRLEYEGSSKKFNTVSDLHAYLANEFRTANQQQAMALKPMQIHIPDFPPDLHHFSIIDTPGPNFAASQNKEHEKITLAAMEEMRHAVFVMNYSTHLTDDEIKLFDIAYKAFNNQQRHQTIMVVINRIDEMYATDVIKSYERFADYLRDRLNKLGYENIVVVSISAITAVYAENVRHLMTTRYSIFTKFFDKLFRRHKADDDLIMHLEKLSHKYRNTDHLTEISYIWQSVKNLKAFHNLTTNSLSRLKEISRIDYLRHIIAIAYNPIEHFEWVDDASSDVYEADFDASTAALDLLHRFANMMEQIFASNSAFTQHTENCQEISEEIFSANTAFLSFFRHLTELFDENSDDDAKAIDYLHELVSVLENDFADGTKLAHRIHHIADDADFSSFVHNLANKDDHEAMNILGIMYSLSYSVPRDPVQAFGWYHRAAKAGNPFSMEKVASHYLYGKGVTKNTKRALAWYNKAISTGNIHAMYELAEIYRLGKNIESDAYRSFLLYRKAAFGGYPLAMCRLANCYRYGEGIAKSFSDADYWYWQAIERGNDDAMYSLVDMHLDSKDWHKASEQLGKNMKLLRYLYYLGAVEEQLYDQAVALYRQIPSLQQPLLSL